MAKQKGKESREELKFEIEQLRKDKMIYALESIALTFISELTYILITVIFDIQSTILAILALVIPLGYYVFMVVGNLLRLRKIKKLEKDFNY
jgi:hypothetical protein